MAKHIHIHFSPRKRVQDQAPGSVPPSGLKALVEALHEALAAREGRTNDAGFDESKVKRDEGGKFSAQQHEAASSQHEAQAKQHAEQAHNIGPDMQGRLAHEAAGKAHMEAAKAHGTAAAHMKAQTGWSSHHAQTAHNATAAAKQATANTAGPANLDQLKATASNPKASVEERAQAVAQLDKMEKAANAVAASPHAVPEKKFGNINVNNPAFRKADGSLDPRAVHLAEESKARADKLAMRGSGKPGPDGKPMGLHPALAAVTPPGAAPAGSAGSPKGNINAVTGKPTSAKATATKAATHELLSSGHPFSIDELMKATGAKSTSTLMTALSDLKSEKYAGKLGKLNIVKRPDGMYHVQGLEQAAAGGAAASKPAGGGNALSKQAQAEFGSMKPEELAAAKAKFEKMAKDPSEHILARSAAMKQLSKIEALGTSSAPAFGPAHNNEAYKAHTEKTGGQPLGTQKTQARIDAKKKTLSKNPGGFNVPSPDPKAVKPIAHASATGQTFLPKVPTKQGPVLHSNFSATPAQEAKLAANVVPKPAAPDFNPAAARATLAAKGVSTSHIGSQPLPQQHQMLKDLMAQHGSTQAKPLSAKPAALKPIPSIKDAWGNNLENTAGYGMKPVPHPYGAATTHLVSGKPNAPGTAHEVYHNGQKIGTVQSYNGYKDGPKINAAGVVAWRKNIVQHQFNMEKGIPMPPHVSSYMKYGSAAEAARALVRHHSEHLKATSGDKK